MNIKRILEVFPRPFSYNKALMKIFDGHNYPVIDIRGWGYLKDMPDGEQIQDDLGEWIVKLLNDENSK